MTDASAMSYIKALIDQWERDLRTADEVVREIRTTLREEQEITDQEIADWKAIDAQEATTDQVADWKYEVANGDTNLGLTEWLEHQAEAKT